MVCCGVLGVVLYLVCSPRSNLLTFDLRIVLYFLARCTSGEVPRAVSGIHVWMFVWLSETRPVAVPLSGVESPFSFCPSPIGVRALGLAGHAI